MHNKDINKLKNFTQGLKPFSNSIPKTLKKYLKKEDIIILILLIIGLNGSKKISALVIR